jgi:hypothetical protein
VQVWKTERGKRIAYKCILRLQDKKNAKNDITTCLYTSADSQSLSSQSWSTI